MKVLGKIPLKWPSITEGIPFAHHFSKHSSTNHSPFELLYNQETVLPIDVTCKLSSIENSDLDNPFDQDIFDTVLASSNVIGEDVHRQAGEHIKRGKKK